ncbi:MAG: 6,7-dimethyl-8-ribityllumazine synthase [Bacteroidota bacterium]|nr:6,7-dimethyl-8-ribityllumazine synthase [Bacteroidota bacterium]
MSINFSIDSKLDKSNFKKYKIGIVKSEWNNNITDSLINSCMSFLLDSGIKQNNIIKINVPGSMELVLGASLLLNKKKVDGVIALGSIIKGDTDHDKYIAQSVSNGLINVSLEYKKPVVFGVLTTNNMKQAIDRCDGKKGNKGLESAYTLLKMLNLRKEL